MIEYRIVNIAELDIDKISSEVSKERLKRAAKYKFEDDRKRSIAVEYLLNEMIRELRPEIKTPVSLEYDDKGKPHLYCGSGEVHFSLSHSGDYAACIIAATPCGIDIERHSERDYEKIAKRVCSNGELENIKCREDFYNVWTIKESVLKAVGLGLALDMRDVRIGDNYFAYAKEARYKVGSVIAPEGYSLSYAMLEQG